MLQPVEATPEYEHFCQGRIADPYPLYDRLRAEDPVHFSARLQTWVISRFDDVKAAAGDDRLSSDRMAFYLNPIAAKTRDKLGSLSAYMSRWMSMKDPPDHTRLRSLVNKAFTPRSIEELNPRIQTICERLVDDFGDEVRIDLIDRFAYPFPATVICEMLGIPAEEQDQFRGWSSDIVAFSAGSGMVLESVAEQAQASQLALVEYCRRIIGERRRRPRDDLISRLIAVSVDDDGVQLTERELHAMCVLLFVAGHETTANLIGNGVLALLQRPGEMQRLRGQPGLIETAIEEFLRFESPVQRAGRIAREDLELRGKRIKKGDSVMLMFGSANRDPEQFANPDRLVLDRSPNRHIGFGRGPHVCIGAPLARREAHIAMTTLVQRLARVELVDPHPSWRPSMAMRSLKSLPVALT